MFERGRYLRLMNMLFFEGEPSVDEALDELERCARTASDPGGAACSLFEDRNWRSHVIASTALAMGLARPRLCVAAWKCLDEGSWASPQIVAALYLADDRFVDEARARLETYRINGAKRFGALASALRCLEPAEGELEVGGRVTERWLARVLDKPGLQERLVDLR